MYSILSVSVYINTAKTRTPVLINTLTVQKNWGETSSCCSYRTPYLGVL